MNPALSKEKARRNRAFETVIGQRLLFLFVLAALLTTKLTLLAGILLLLAPVVVIAPTLLVLLVLLVLLALLILLILLTLARLILVGDHATSPQMASERCREQTIGWG